MSTDRDPEKFIDESAKNIKEYIELKNRLIRLELAEKTAIASGTLLSLIVIAGIVLIVFALLISLAGIALSTMVGSYLIGFGITTLIALFVLIILLSFRTSLITKPVANLMIGNILGEDELNEEE